MISRPKPHIDKRKVFILRIWPHGRDELDWVGEVQEVSTGEIVHLQSLEALFAWLRQKTVPAPDALTKTNKDMTSN
jgi:hypothetical protein